MAILDITRDFSNEPNIVRILTDNTQAQISTPGYLSAQTSNINSLNGGNWVWQPGDVVLISGTDGSAFYTVNASFTSFVIYVPPGSSVTPSQIQNEAFVFGPDTGSADAYVVALNPPVTSYVDGLSFTFIPANNNLTTTPTLDAGAGPVNIYGPNGTVISPNDIQGQIPSRVTFYQNQFFLTSLDSAQIKSEDLVNNTYIFATDTSSSGTTYTATIQATGNLGSAGMSIVFIPNTTNTGAATLEVTNASGQTVGPLNIITPDGNALAPNSMFMNNTYYLVGNFLTNWVLLNSSASSGGGSVTPQDLQNQTFTLVTTTGTNTLTGTANPPLTAYNDGMLICSIGGQYDSSVGLFGTINIDGLGAKNIQYPFTGTVAQANDITSIFPAYLYFSASADRFYLLNPQGASKDFSYLIGNYNTAADNGISNNYRLFFQFVNFNAGNFLNNGTTFSFQTFNDNTASPTLDLVGLNGTVVNAGSIFDMQGNALVGGEITFSGGLYQVMYSNGNWVLVNPSVPLGDRHFAGNPNTHVAGNLYQTCIDTTNNFMYWCSTAGNAASAVWTKIVM